MKSLAFAIAALVLPVAVGPVTADELPTVLFGRVVYSWMDDRCEALATVEITPSHEETVAIVIELVYDSRTCSGMIGGSGWDHYTGTGDSSSGWTGTQLLDPPFTSEVHLTPSGPGHYDLLAGALQYGQTVTGDLSRVI